jgi:hypothetical protein
LRSDFTVGVGRSIAGRYPRGEQAGLSAEEIERLRSLRCVR